MRSAVGAIWVCLRGARRRLQLDFLVFRAAVRCRLDAELAVTTLFCDTCCKEGRGSRMEEERLVFNFAECPECSTLALREAALVDG